MKYLSFIKLGCRILLIGQTFLRAHKAQILKFHILYFFSKIPPEKCQSNNNKIMTSIIIYILSFESCNKPI